MSSGIPPQGVYPGRTPGAPKRSPSAPPCSRVTKTAKTPSHAPSSPSSNLAAFICSFCVTKSIHWLDGRNVHHSLYFFFLCWSGFYQGGVKTHPDFLLQKDRVRKRVCYVTAGGGGGGRVKSSQFHHPQRLKGHKGVKSWLVVQHSASFGESRDKSVRKKRLIGA